MHKHSNVDAMARAIHRSIVDATARVTKKRKGGRDPTLAYEPFQF